VHYSSQKVERVMSKYFKIEEHIHSYDGHNLNGKFDRIKYDAEKEKSFRNGAIIVGQKIG
jgi:hypothetical protein